MAGVQGSQEGIISKEILQKLRSRLGSQHRIVDCFNELASKEAIRKFADGIGDPNPLWRDGEYAQKTQYGCIVAPPSWLYSVFVGWDLFDVPAGISLIPAGHDWEFFKPVLVGDSITVDHKYTDLDMKQGGSRILDGQEGYYSNQEGQLVAKVKSWRISVKSLSEGNVKFQEGQSSSMWSEAELTRLEKEMFDEQIRGSNPRYWEDVEKGEDLPPVVKGPLGLGDMIAFLIGASPVRITAHKSTLLLLSDYPRLAFRDPETCSLERRDSAHFNRVIAKLVGTKSGFCYGGQNHCWVTQLLTDWMGNDGWLKKSSVQYRGIISFSDVVRCQGKVIKKYIDENNEYCLDIETNVINQRGSNVVSGQSTIVLPSKEKKNWPLEKRLPFKS